MLIKLVCVVLGWAFGMLMGIIVGINLWHVVKEEHE